MITYERLFGTLFAIGGVAFLVCGYYFLRFQSKLQDALIRRLIPSSLIPKGRMELLWMINVGDMVPGAGAYRRRCIVALAIAIGVWVLAALLSGLGPRNP